jgi:hypothetical protein
VVSSASKIHGTNNDGTFFVDCSHLRPADTTKQYQFAVEYFVTATNIDPTLINIPSLTQVNSYSTLTKSHNYNVAMVDSYSYSQTIHHNSVGRLLTNIDFLTSSMMNIQFTDMSGTVLTNMATWALSLVIWEVDQE